MYHGKFNGQRFNSVDHPSDIPIRDILSGAADNNATLSAFIDESVPAAAAIRSRSAVGIPVAGEVNGEGTISASSPVLLPFLFATQKKRRGFNAHPFNTGDREEYIHAPETWSANVGGISSAAGAVGGGMRAAGEVKASRLSLLSAFAYSLISEAGLSASSPALIPTVSAATGRAAHHPGFNHAPFNTESDTAYSVKPITWRADVEGKTPILRNVMNAGIKGKAILDASFPPLTEIYPFSVPAADAILASAPELLPTIPLGTRKTPRPPGFNHIPFDSYGEAVYTAQPITWRGDFDGRRPLIQNEIDGSAELSEALNADVVLILNCYVVWTADNGLNGGFDLKPTVYVGQIRIRRRGFNHGILNRERHNLVFRDRYVRTPLTWLARFDAHSAGQIIVKGGELDAEKLKAILDCSGFPVAYNHFISAPTLPFIVYMRVTSPNYFADNRVFRHLNRWNVYLCTEFKSRAAERKLEAVLDEFSIPYEVVDEVFIDDERLYQIIYQFEELEE